MPVQDIMKQKRSWSKSQQMHQKSFDKSKVNMKAVNEYTNPAGPNNNHQRSKSERQTYEEQKVLVQLRSQSGIQVQQ